MLIEIGSSDITIERHCIVIRVILGFNDIELVSNKVGMLDSPAQRLYFLDGDIPSKIVNFSFGILSVTLQT